jgi:hypothetical protein
MWFGCLNVYGLSLIGRRMSRRVYGFAWCHVGVILVCRFLTFIISSYQGNMRSECFVVFMLCCQEAFGFDVFVP